MQAESASISPKLAENTEPQEMEAKSANSDDGKGVFIVFID